MTPSVFFAEASLLVIVVLGVAGTLYQHYRENWVQFIGLASTSVSAAIMFVRMHEIESVPIEMTFFAFGVAAFMAGIAIKVWAHRPPGARTATD